MGLLIEASVAVGTPSHRQVRVERNDGLEGVFEGMLESVELVVSNSGQDSV